MPCNLLGVVDELHVLTEGRVRHDRVELLLDVEKIAPLLAFAREIETRDIVVTTLPQNPLNNTSFTDRWLQNASVESLMVEEDANNWGRCSVIILCRAVRTPTPPDGRETSRSFVNGDHKRFGGERPNRA